MIWLVATMATAAPMDTWLGTAPLQADTDLLLEMAEAADEEADPAILAEHRRYEWDEAGNLHERLHRVYLVQSADTADSWGYSTGSWAPWHEEPVEIQARVITPEGRVAVLDPSAIVEESREAAGATTYSDGRTRNAPLPAMAPGVVVEEVVDWVRHPLLPGVPDNAWASGWFSINHPGVVTTFLAPRGTDLNVSVRGDGIERKNHREGTARGFRLSFPPYDSDAIIPGAWPQGVHGISSVVVSLPVTWGHIAEVYAAEVEPIVDGADVQALVDAARASSSDPEAQVDLVAELVRDDIRYVALELGQNAIIPHAPSEVLDQGMGDCKDKATVLIAALRALGHNAWLTLINTGPGVDVEPTVPNLGAFNHAIVALGQPDGTLRFIDPTADRVPVTELPFEDQGRRVLVIRPETQGLTPTPMAGAEAHAWDHTYDATFSEAGYPQLTERTRATGRYAADARDTDPLPDSRRRQEYADWGEERAGTEVDVLALEIEGDDARSPEYHRTITWSEMPVGESTGTEAVMWLDFADDVAWPLPDPVLSEDEDDWALADRPFGVRVDPFHAATTWHATVPAGFAVRYAPPSESKAWGPVHYTRDVTNQDGDVTVTVTLASDAGTLSVDEAVALRDWAFDELRSERWHVAWTDAAVQLADLGHPYESISQLAARYRQDPERAYTGTALSGALLDAGFTRASRTIAEDVSERDPEIAAAWRLRALSHMRTDHGAVSEAVWDAEKVHDYMGRSLEFEENSVMARKLHALFALLVHEGEQEGIDAAVEDFAAIRELGAAEDDTALVRAMLGAEDFDGLQAYATGRDEQAWQVGAISAQYGKTGELGAYDSVPVRVAVAVQFLSANDVDRAAAVLQGIEPADAGPGAALVHQLRPLGRNLSPRRHPEDAIRAIGAGIHAGEVDTDLVSRQAPESLIDDAFGSSGVEGFSPETLGWLVARAPMHAEGNDDTGYRILGDMESMQGTIGYVVKERGSYRLFADASHLDHLARHAMTLAERGESEAAHQWVVWMFESSPDNARRSEVLNSSPQAWLWNHGESQDEALVAAAILADGGDADETVVALLQDRLQTAEGDDAIAIRFALADAYTTLDQPSKAYEAIKGNYETDPGNGYLQRVLLNAATSDEERAEAIELVRAQAPLSPQASATLASVLVDRNDPEGIEILGRLATQVGASPYDRNNYAWHLATVYPDRAGEALRLLRDGTANREPSMSALHTQASLEILVGEPDRAFATLQQANQQMGEDGMLDPAWVTVRSQLLAHWGLVDDAQYMLDEIPDEDLGAFQIWVDRAQASVDAARSESL